MKQIVVWIRVNCTGDNERPVIKVGSHWRGNTKQAKLAAYLPGPKVSRLLTLHKLLGAIENQKSCVSRSGDIFELTNKDAIRSLMALVDRFLSGRGYQRV